MSKNQIQDMNKNGIMYNKKGEIDFLATIPDFAVLYDAMERGESWFDVMYPRIVNHLPKIENTPTESGKKRKYPFKDTENNSTKKMRYN